MNWFWKRSPRSQNIPELTTSILYNEDTFYKQFVKDLLLAKEEVIIESPYITKARLEMFKIAFETLVNRDVQVFIITKNPNEHDDFMAGQAETGVCYLEEIGVQVLMVKGGHHRKMAMIDRSILYEGSLNILSQAYSREVMRRLESKRLAEEMFKFVKFDQLDIFKKKLVL